MLWTSYYARIGKYDFVYFKHSLWTYVWSLCFTPFFLPMMWTRMSDILNLQSENSFFFCVVNLLLSSFCISHFSMGKYDFDHFKQSLRTFSMFDLCALCRFFCQLWVSLALRRFLFWYLMSVESIFGLLEGKLTENVRYLDHVGGYTFFCLLGYSLHVLYWHILILNW